MKRVTSIQTAVLMTVALAAGATTARADGYIAPFAGVNFGGAAGQTLQQAQDKGRIGTWGLDIGGMSGGIFGAELDIAYTKNFFGQGGSVSDNNLLTVMPALIIGIPVGGQRGPSIRPYATAGMGLIRRNLDFGGTQVFKGGNNDLGYTLGAGVMGFVATHFGIRADYHYFRNVKVDEAFNLGNLSIDRGTFNYSRASVGAVFKF